MKNTFAEIKEQLNKLVDEGYHVDRITLRYDAFVNLANTCPESVTELKDDSQIAVAITKQFEHPNMAVRVVGRDEYKHWQYTGSKYTFLPEHPEYAIGAFK